MLFHNILFDLDGTLTASGPGITHAAQYALYKMGIEETDASKLTFFVGPPLALTFQEHYGMDPAQAAQAIRYFREMYEKKGVFENAVYPGIPKMLGELSAAGCRLAVASSKREELVYEVLQYFRLDGYFDVIVGASPNKETDDELGIDHKQVMIARTLRALGIKDPDEPARESGSRLSSRTGSACKNRPWLSSRTGSAYESGSRSPSRTGSTRAGKQQACAMVGDRFYDIRGARANHLTAVGVSYGYGTRQELEQAGADYVADSVEDLQDYLLSGLVI